MKKFFYFAFITLLACKNDPKISEQVDVKKSDSTAKTSVGDTVKKDSVVALDKNIKILIPRSYRNWDKNNRANDLNNNWTELYSKNGKYFLDKANYKIEKSYDECSGDSTKIIIPKNETLLYINTANIPLGNINSLAIKKNKIWPKEKINFLFNNTEYTLRADGEVLSSEQVTSEEGQSELYQNVKNYKLFISTKNSPERLLLNIENFNDTFVKLLFVGDIDQDGKLDFVFDASRDYEEERLILYLSSPAKNGNLVKEVAEIAVQFDC